MVSIRVRVSLRVSITIRLIHYSAMTGSAS